MRVHRHFILEARAPLTREEFQRTHPRGSLAIDGYLPEAPWMDLQALQGNMNHHEAVDRLCTRCTAAQVALGVRMGRFESFFKEGLHVWMNDCDPDVIVALWILENPARMRGVLNPLFNKMLHLLDRHDIRYEVASYGGIFVKSYMIKVYFDNWDHYRHFASLTGYLTRLSKAI